VGVKVYFCLIYHISVWTPLAVWGTWGHTRFVGIFAAAYPHQCEQWHHKPFVSSQ